MMFVLLGYAKSDSTTKARIARRAQWQYDPDVRVVAEYWLLGDPVLVLVLEADNVGAIMRGVAEWDDHFDMAVLPAVTAEQGLQAAGAMLQGASAYLAT